jgi:hypothetical protein
MLTPGRMLGIMLGRDTGVMLGVERRASAACADGAGGTGEAAAARGDEGRRTGNTPTHERRIY